MSKEQIVDEIHKPARKNFVRCPVILKAIDDLWQADLIDIQKFKRFNQGYAFILIVIDCFSKYAWTAPLKTKSKGEVTKSFKDILLKSQRHPMNLQTDMGKEFFNDSFQNLTKSLNINHYTTYSIKKASIVERLIRTIKSKLFKSFHLKGTYKWVGLILDNVVHTYNNTNHRTIKMKPVEVCKSNEVNVRKNIIKSQKRKISLHKKILRIGDHVRISKYKNCFQKGYTPNWSTEIFIITKINRTNPVTYHIADQRKQPIYGLFYEQELQKTKHPNVYLVEKVIKTKGNKLLVKWLGLSEEENCWIDRKALIK